MSSAGVDDDDDDDDRIYQLELIIIFIFSKRSSFLIGFFKKDIFI